MSPPSAQPSARPLTRVQAAQNAAFLAQLTRTGNVRLSAREAGVSYGTIQRRRSRHPGFAQRWDAALATAQARLNAAGGTTVPVGATGGDPHRTQGGEPVVVRVRVGRLQVRRAHPGKLTRACEQAFLAALSATANVSLSAAAAGAAEAAFYRRRRQHSGFAREMRLALEMGYRRLELALLEAADPEAHADDGWRHNEPPPIPPMTAAQALHLLYLHHKEVMGGTPEPLRRRPGETSGVQSLRLQLLHEHREERYREKSRIAQAARNGGGPVPGETPPLLPALDQVTGWSAAKEGGPGGIFARGWWEE